MSSRRSTVVVHSNMKMIARASPKFILDAMADVGEIWVRIAERIIFHTGHVFTHRLRNDIEWSTKRTDSGLELRFFIPATNHHGVVIHENRKPRSAWPPTEAIANWVEKKLGIERDNKKFDNIVFNIRRNIGRHGMSSLPAGGLQFAWEPLLEYHEKWLEQIATDANRGMVRRFRDTTN